MSKGEGDARNKVGEKSNEKGSTQKSEKTIAGISRRKFITGAAIAAPVLATLGGVEYMFHEKNKSTKARTNGLNFTFEEEEKRVVDRSKTIQLGIIGAGIRGTQLLGDLGFVPPENIDKYLDQHDKNPENSKWQRLQDQPDLNVNLRAVCDIFDKHADRAIRAGGNSEKLGTADSKAGAKDAPIRYRTYLELLDDPEIDAVIIASPDHWHGPMAIDAAKRGKHIYLEKPITHRLEDTFILEEAVKSSGVVFQLGHQNRQIEAYDKTRQIVANGALGDVSLIETTTNRNSANGAWVYPIAAEASPSTIDWEQFLGYAPKVPFNKEHFFRWRCWWDYSTGLIGDLFTHEYDCINQIFNIGIPSTATSSGGIYHFKDGRTVPDVVQISLEFEKHDMTMLYSATQANGYNRGRYLMGTDAAAKVGGNVDIFVDRASKKYEQEIKEGWITPGEPISLMKATNNLDGFTSATERYFAERGLLSTSRGGKQYSTTFLHFEEWLDAIRTDGKTSCNIDRAFEEGIASHMATIAYRERRTVRWDEEKREIL